MKKIILIASALIICFTSCSIEDKIESVFDDSLPSVEQEVNEDVTIESTQLPGPGEVSKEVTIDITEIKEKIEESSDNSSVNVNTITVEDLEITLLDSSEQANFDFIDNAMLVLSSGNETEDVIFDFGPIEKGTTSLTLTEDTNINIIDFINETENNELTVDLNLSTNTAIENDIEFKLTSILLADLGVDL